MKTKELYTHDHEIDLSQEPNEYPPDYQEWLDQQNPKDWYKQQDADKEFIESLDDCPF